MSLVYLVVCRVLSLRLVFARRDVSKDLEILVLRHEPSILRRQAPKPVFTPNDRLLLAAFSRVLPRRSWHVFLVRPETLLRWHRRLVARRWTYPHRSLGRPPVDEAVRELILRLARENTSWGYVRIVGELHKLGVDVSATLVRNVLSAAGVPPAPQRDRLAWRAFVCQHAATMLACDFFTLFRSGSVRVIRTPVRAPNANAHIERWIGSVRRECLDRLLIINRRQLERIVRV